MLLDTTTFLIRSRAILNCYYLKVLLKLVGKGSLGHHFQSQPYGFKHSAVQHQQIVVFQLWSIHIQALNKLTFLLHNFYLMSDRLLLSVCAVGNCVVFLQVGKRP